MSTDADRELQARIETLRRELAGLVIALSSAGRRLDDLTEDLCSRVHAAKVVPLDRRRGCHDPDILLGFFDQ